MRQLLLQLPAGSGRRAHDLARSHGASNIATWQGRGGDDPCDLLVVHVPNQALGRLLAALDEEIGEVRASFLSQGALALRPPPGEAPEQVLDVAPRSPLEIFLSGLQSVGSWGSFLAYAAASGAVVWLGLTTGTAYLLTAAMLIAPFASPAMNAALASARGDGSLLLRSLGRYFASLALTVCVAALLTLVFGPESATQQMVATARIASTAALLPLVAGAAGALHLAQSERSSLVTAAGTGMLVAASLAPPSALVGMAAVLGQWNLAKSGLFLLLLQVVGIQLAGALVFRIFGVAAQGRRYPEGRRAVVVAAAAMALLVFGGLLAWQRMNPPSLQRDSVETKASGWLEEEMQARPGVTLLEARVRFPKPAGATRDVLLAEAWVLGPAGMQRRLEARIRARFEAEMPQLVPAVRVHVLQGATQQAR